VALALLLSVWTDLLVVPTSAGRVHHVPGRADRAVLVLRVHRVWALAVATVLIGLVAAVSAVRSRGSAPWHAVTSSA